MNLAHDKLREALSDAGLPSFLWQFPDVSYETVSPEWVVENWGAWLDARPAELVVFGDAGGKRIRRRPLWIAEVSDCDNLALGTVAHAQTGNALASQRTGKARGGLAYGFLFYTAGPARLDNYQVAGPHSINWFMNHEGEVRFFEPGVGGLTDLDPIERGGAWFGLAA